MSIDTEITPSPETLFSVAIVDCLKANVPLATLYEGRIYRHNPESIDAFNVANSILVWPEPAATNLNPQPADFAHPTFSFVIMLVKDTISRPLEALELDAMDELWHIEKILERGTVNPVTGAAFDSGKLVNPQIDPTDPLVPPVMKYLNRMKPVFSKRSKRVIRSTSTTAWPLIATYSTTSTREERRPA